MISETKKIYQPPKKQKTMLKQSLTYLLIPMQTASPTTRCKVQHIRELLCTLLTIILITEF